MTEYEVTISRVGTVRVTAASKAEAMILAEKTPIDAIGWEDGFSVTDAEESDPFGTMS